MNQINHRAILLEALSIPPTAHLYVIPHALYKLNGRFDDVLSRILLQDKLGDFDFDFDFIRRLCYVVFGTEYGLIIILKSIDRTPTCQLLNKDTQCKCKLAQFIAKINNKNDFVLFQAIS